MSSFFPMAGLNTTNISLRCLGGLAPKAVNAIYPMDLLTKFHSTNHLPGLTGRWMDTGAFALGGSTKGSFHRLAHGHHLFEDGFKVLVNKKLSYGEFLHHLGMDSLTVRGIPNPLFPTLIGQKLIDLGMSKQFVSELLTINVPKILSGSLSLICSGLDVYACFSDAIPHTFLASGFHFGIGTTNIIFGMYPPNIFLLSAGAAEIGVGAMTAYNTIVDPIIPSLGVPSSVFLPSLGSSIALSSLIGACAGIFTGKDWTDVPKNMVEAAASGAVSTTVSFMAAGNGFISPFIGPLSGIATFLLLKKVLDSIISSSNSENINYQEYGTEENLSIFNQNQALPLFGMPLTPIGMLKNDRLILSEKELSKQEELWAI